MAGEWIKVECDAPDKPELFRLARLLKLERDLVFGKLVRMWIWFDRNSVDGVVDGVVSRDMDAFLACPGFSEACAAVGWLVFDDEAERLTLPNFSRHNGETAKKRALKNERQSRWRHKVDANDDSSSSTGASTGASTREEKRREEKEAKTPPPAAEEILWRYGLELLTSTGTTEPSARSFIGRLVKDFGTSEALRGVEAAMDAKAGDPKAYISAVLNQKTGQRRVAV